MNAKKPYQRPRLTVYGQIRQLTRAASALTNAKDGGPNNTKT